MNDIFKNSKKGLYLTIDDEGKLILPKDYYWCCDCLSITPHESVKFKFGIEYYCKICGESIKSYDDYDACPNCKWNDNNIHEDKIIDNVTVHNDGCHLSTPLVQNLCRCERNFWESCNDGADGVVHISYDGMSYGEYILESFFERLSFNEQTRLQKLYNYHKDMECGCPSYEVIRTPNVFNYHVWSYVSYDCMNAVQWSYDVRCPICGCVYNVSDTNC